MMKKAGCLSRAPLSTIGSVLLLSMLLSACGLTSGARQAKLSGEAAAQKTSASFIAALNGGVISRAEGLSLSKANRQRALEAEYRALEAAPGGQPVVWSGSGISGSVVAAAPYQVGSQNCRQYSHTVTAKGQPVTARGAACRNADGSWTPLG